MDSAPRKSLAIPTNTVPDDYRAYVEHPEVATLNQIMLHYLDMEEILKLYRQNHEQFETRQALTTLAQRFKLPLATDFKRLLRAYDIKYATVRSYLYNNRNPVEILLQAAYEGNIQALYNQLKLYPELRKKYVYTEALGRAAKGGHEAIMDLLLELGAKDKYRTVFRNAVEGGQLALVQKELAKGVDSKTIEQAICYGSFGQHKDVLAALLDYSTSDETLAAAMKGAGKVGNDNIISYVISRGGNDYPALIESAAMHGHFDVVRQYWDKLSDNHTRLNKQVFSYAIKNLNLTVAKFLVKSRLISKASLDDNLRYLVNRRKELLVSQQRTNKTQKRDLVEKQTAAANSIIAYLESKGAVINDESSEESSSD